MEDIIVKYGLWNIKEKKLLKFTNTSNSGADICRDTSTELDTYGDSIWLADSAINAEYVRNFTTPWYNAGYLTPMHGYESDELIVVRVTIKANIESEDVRIPDSREFFTKKYQKKNPDHLKQVLEIIDEGREMRYSFYDLEEWIEERIKENKSKYEARSKKVAIPKEANIYD